MSRYDDLFEETAPDDSVFANKRALDPLTEPAEIVARTDQERQLATILNGVQDGYLPPTVSIYGPPGTGKTLTTRRLCRAFAARHDQVAVEYVNLKECRTLFSAANEILLALIGEQKGAYAGLDGVFTSMWAALEEYPAWTVLLLDEIDHVQQDTNYDPNDFFYRLLRGEGKLAREISLSVWLLSNELLEVDLRLDSRVQSAMSDEAVFFSPYSNDELDAVLVPRYRESRFRFHGRWLFVSEPFLGPVPVFGIPDINAPAVHPNRVDCPPGLDEQIDRVGQFVLATIGGLDEVARVEDLRRKRIEAGHDEIRRWIVGFLHYLDDLAVLVGIEDAIAGGLLPRNFLHEERGVGALFLLAVDHVAEIRPEDVVPEHKHEVVVDMRFRLQDGVGEPELLALVGISDRDALVLVAVALDYLLFHVADDEDELGRADLDEVVHDVLEEGFAVDLDEDFGFVVGERPEARSFTCRQYDCLHVSSSYNGDTYTL